MSQNLEPLSKKSGTKSKKPAKSNERTSIRLHEGKKYLRTIYSAVDTENRQSIEIDVYAVLDAFHVCCPATAHAIKKLLCAGQRGKGDLIADLTGAIAAIHRAIELAEI